MSNFALEILKLIEKSPSPFHAVKTISEVLDSEGFTYLKEGKNWDLKSGQKYYTTRNNTSIVAFDIPAELKDLHFQICSSHLDSPTYKIKDESELNGPNEYIRLDVEGYGGMIDYTWLDKPLSIAGRVMVKENGIISSRLVYINKNILLIPSVAIHMNRDVNNGYKFNKKVDLCPLFSTGALKKGAFNKMLSEELGISVDSIIGKDLFLVNREEGIIWGYNKEFVSSPKLDDLEAAFTSLLGFVSSKNKGNINVYVAFDNEEVGSNTKQGAMSTFLKDTLKRITLTLSESPEDYYRSISKSFMVSFDNAHAVHPNHPELSDEVNKCYMNKGIVIKENASQKYTTDAFSRSIFKSILESANIPYQNFANRSDMAGGSTLGNLSNTEVSMNAIDIGLAQLAMHSSYETAGRLDIEYAIHGIYEYYSHIILIDESEKVVIR